MTGFKVGEIFVAAPTGMRGYVIARLKPCQVRFENGNVLLLDPKALTYHSKITITKVRVGEIVFFGALKGEVVKVFDFYLSHLQDAQIAVLTPEIMMKAGKKIVTPAVTKILQPGQGN